MARPAPENDKLGAFCTHAQVSLDGADSGPLAGLKMGVKDLFDIAGHKTGFGNPDWYDSHDAASATASVVTRALDAGADMVGKTICDELCFSLYGENSHYGTPVNVNAPGRVPGGSSSGSAAAVAGGLVDFALGSDTGGSVRLPACYCGIHGIRTTHGRIATDGVAPLAPGFDVIGWFARDGDLFQRLGEVLLGDFRPAKPPTRLIIVDDAFEIAGETATNALAPGVAAVSAQVNSVEHITLGVERIRQWVDDFRHLQGAEIWQTHGDWITQQQPKIGPGISERLQWTSQIDKTSLGPTRQRQRAWREEIGALLPVGTVMCLPLSPGPAPLLNQPPTELEEYRSKLFRLLSLSGLAGTPQISLPLGTIDTGSIDTGSAGNCPIGLGVMAGHGEDETLLALAGALAA